jgi:hypothetical protein
MNLKNKKGFSMNRNVLLVGALILVSLSIALYFGLFGASIYNGSCQLGWSADVVSYTSDSVTISANLGRTTSKYGCISTQAPDRGGFSIIKDKTFCNSFFGDSSWNDEFSFCSPVNSNYINDKVISTYGSCHITCEDDKGTGYCSNDFPKGSSITIPYSDVMSFNGAVINVNAGSANSEHPIYCNGGFIISLKQNTVDYYRFSNNECNKVSILTSAKTSNDYLTLTECAKNIQSISDIPSTLSSNGWFYDLINKIWNQIIGWFKK